jgi:hypothetical protein
MRALVHTQPPPAGVVTPDEVLIQFSARAHVLQDFLQQLHAEMLQRGLLDRLPGGPKPYIRIRVATTPPYFQTLEAPFDYSPTRCWVPFSVQLELDQ